MSETMNSAICKALGLDVNLMWDLASREKLERAHGTNWRAVLPMDQRLREAWEDLTLAEQDQLSKMALGMATANRVRREIDSVNEPEAVVARLKQLVERLTELATAKESE
jgi:hypothetical protein